MEIWLRDMENLRKICGGFEGIISCNNRKLVEWLGEWWISHYEMVIFLSKKFVYKKECSLFICYPRLS